MPSLLLSVVVLASLPIVQATPEPHAAIRPVPRMDKWWQERHAKVLERVKAGDPAVIFIGDSITQGWEGAGKEEWEKRFAPHKALNLGFSGDRTQHVLWRLNEGKELEGMTPKVAIIMIGTNNIPTTDTPDQIAEGIESIVKLLRTKQPKIRVLLLAVFPRAPKPDHPFRARIKEVNDRIAKLDDGMNIKFMDIASAFLAADGALPSEVMPDFLHLSKEGYRRWAEAIEPTMQQLLK